VQAPGELRHSDAGRLLSVNVWEAHATLPRFQNIEPIMNKETPQFPTTYQCSRCGSVDLVANGTREAQEAQFRRFLGEHRDCKFGR
jgi:hypothetical protein